MTIPVSSGQITDFPRVGQGDDNDVSADNSDPGRTLRTVLCSITPLLTSAQDLSFLNRLIFELCGLFRAQRGSIMLLEVPGEARSILELSAHLGLPTEAMAPRQAAGVAARVIAEGRPVLIIDGNDFNTRFNGIAPKLNISSSMCVPIATPQGVVFGVVNIGRSQLTAEGKQAPPLSRSDLEVCDGLAMLLGDTLEKLKSQAAERAMSERLRVSEALSLLGEVAAGIAHEIANPLTSVRSNIQAIGEYIAELSPLFEGAAPHFAEITKDLPLVVREVQEGIERVEAIIHNTKAMVRPQTHDTQQQEVSLADLATGATKLLKSRLRSRITVQVPADVMVRRNVDITQVLINLIVNADDACQERVTRATAAGQVGPKELITVQGGYDSCPWIEITDNGTGIDPAVLKQIFRPLYTTKVGTGTGLGLSVSRRLVEMQGGSIEVRSIVGEGTTFRVWLGGGFGANKKVQPAVEVVVEAAIATGPSVSERFGRSSLAACRSQFPRACSCCDVHYPSFESYIARTTVLGHPMLDPIEDDEPIGLLGFANCACGTTLAIRYEDTREHSVFNKAVFDEAKNTDRAEPDVLVELIQVVHRYAKEGISTVGMETPAPPDPVMLELGASLIDVVRRGAITMPPTPTAALKVRGLVQADTVNVRAVADALAADAGLTTAVLRVANSAFFQRGAEVNSLPLAITRLGFKGIASLSLTLGVGRTFHGNGPFAVQRQLLWRRSLLTAFLAKSLADVRNLDADECFVSGLFSSLGAVVGTLSLEVLLKERTDLPTQPWSWWLRLIELFSADLGAEVARKWELPSLIASVASHPHGCGLSRPPNAEIVEAVHTASKVALRAMESTSLNAKDLEGSVPGASAAEVEVLVKTLPGCVDAMAAIDSGVGARTASSSFGMPAVGEVIEPPAPVPPMTAVTLLPAGAEFEVVGLGSEVVVLKGPMGFPETTLVSIELGLEPRLKLWATSTRSKAMGDSFRVYLTPFALDEDSYHRWRLLLTDQLAERTKLTRQQMVDRRQT